MHLYISGGIYVCGALVVSLICFSSFLSCSITYWLLVYSPFLLNRCVAAMYFANAIVISFSLKRVLSDKCLLSSLACLASAHLLCAWLGHVRT